MRRNARILAGRGYLVAAGGEFPPCLDVFDARTGASVFASKSSQPSHASGSDSSPAATCAWRHGQSTQGWRIGDRAVHAPRS